MIIQGQETIVKVRCPICGSRIADRLKSYEIELKPYFQEDARWRPELIEKCHKCKTAIGIKKK